MDLTAAMHARLAGATRWLSRRSAATRPNPLPSGSRQRILVVAQSLDPEHIRLALDAIESHHPGSLVHVLTDRACAGLGEFADLTVECGLWETGPAMTDPAVLLQLHPWPYISPERTTTLAGLRSVTRRLARAFPRAHAWVHMRNLDLYGLGRAEAATRRVCGALGAALRPAVMALEESQLQRVVEPLLPRARSWSGAEVCTHAAAVPVFLQPRRISFCPECGMGITPPGGLPADVDSGDYYGEGYATRGKFIGWREFERSAREETDRLGEAMGALLPGEGCAAPPSELPSVLDFGCGNGRFAAFWAGRGHRYVGVEPSERSVEFARRLAKRQRLSDATFEVGALDAATASRPRGGYGVIFMSHVLEHIPDPVGVLSSLRALAGPSALLFVEVPNAFAYTWSRRFRGFGNFEHTWDFTPAMLMATARAAGWMSAGTWCHPDPDLHPYVAMIARNPAGPGPPAACPGPSDRSQCG